MATRPASSARPDRLALAALAEPDPALVIGAVLDIGDLVGGDQDLAALGHRQREDGMGRVGQRGSELALDVLRRRVGLHDQLARHGLDADLDFHGAPLPFTAGLTCSVLATSVLATSVLATSVLATSVLAAREAADAAPG